MRHHSLRPLLALATAAALGALPSAQQIVRVSDTGAHVKHWTEDGQVRAAVSRDGGATWGQQHAPKGELTWRSRSFDPLQGDAAIPATLRAGVDNQLFYVQFVTDVISEYATALAELGADVTRYYPHEAFIVRIARDRIDAVRDRPFVRAVMELELGHKLDTDIQEDLVSGDLLTGRYNILMVDKHKDAGLLEARIEELGGVVNVYSEGGILVDATLTPEQLRRVAAENTVLWIDRWTAPEDDMDNLRIQAGVDWAEINAGMTGLGVRGHINEGIFATHPELAAIPGVRDDPISLGPSGGSEHGTNTAGIIYAQGLSNGVKGALPDAQLIYSNRAPNRYGMVQELQAPTQSLKAMMMTQSWGGGRTANYTSTSALLDDILFDFEHMFATNSQSNAGNQQSRPEAWAKNVCGIGGFNHFDDSNPGNDCWCNTGSTGPAQDGRVGVTFAAYYDSIRTISGTSGYTNGFGGTSGATPIVNGLAGGALQMFTDGLLGYPGVPWQNRFDARPNLTTTRVLLSMVTRQVDFTGPSAANRFQQGWGLPNLKDLTERSDEILVLDEEDVLTEGTDTEYWVWVPAGTPQFRASMHHLEDEAVPSAIPTRINSLDLSVLDPSGQTWWGNDTSLIQNQFGAPGGSANDIDIHENVFILAPEPGIYRVKVAAPFVRQDSHKETGATDADFALAIRGIGAGRNKSGIVLDLVSDTPGQFDVVVSNLPATGWTTGNTVFSLDTDRHLSLGHRFGMELDPLSRNILRRAPSAGAVFSFTNSTDPADYPNATFSFPGPLSASVAGITFDAMLALFDANGDLVDLSNVDRVTVQ